jgi:ankyrin repeat protein
MLPNHHGKTAFETIDKRKNREIFELLSVTSCEKNFQHIYNIILQSDNADKVRDLLNAMPKATHERLFKMREDLEGSLLHYAVTRGRLEIAKVLLEFGADINNISQDGITPIQYAVILGDKGMYDMLMSYHPDLMTKSFTNANLCHFAAVRGNMPILRDLWDRLPHAMWYEANEYGNASFHVAAISGSKDVVHYLVQMLGEGIVQVPSVIESETMAHLVMRIKTFNSESEDESENKIDISHPKYDAVLYLLKETNADFFFTKNGKGKTAYEVSKMRENRDFYTLLKPHAVANGIEKKSSGFGLFDKGVVDSNEVEMREFTNSQADNKNEPEDTLSKDKLIDWYALAGGIAQPWR